MSKSHEQPKRTFEAKISTAEELALNNTVTKQFVTMPASICAKQNLLDGIACDMNESQFNNMFCQICTLRNAYILYPSAGINHARKT